MNRLELIGKLRELRAGLRAKAGVASTNEGRRQATEDAEMIQDAISFLTPRVYDVSELTERTVGWLEYMGDVFPVIVGESVDGAHCLIDGIQRNLGMKDKDYGRVWRVWTLEPTQEQREGVKWE